MPHTASKNRLTQKAITGSEVLVWEKVLRMRVISCIMLIGCRLAPVAWAGCSPAQAVGRLYSPHGCLYQRFLFLPSFLPRRLRSGAAFLFPVAIIYHYSTLVNSFFMTFSASAILWPSESSPPAALSLAQISCPAPARPRAQDGAARCRRRTSRVQSGCGPPCGSVSAASRGAAEL